MSYVICSCGRKISELGLNRHKKTRLHRLLMRAIYEKNKDSDDDLEEDGPHPPIAILEDDIENEDIVKDNSMNSKIFFDPRRLIKKLK